MRLVLAALITFSAGSIVAAAYTNQSVNNYAAYANVHSRAFAEGDFNDDSGWRGCNEMVNTNTEVGMVCEGLRTIAVHGGKRVDVNYYCEYRFKKTAQKFEIESENCQ